jgi:hypothetical protein
MLLARHLMSFNCSRIFPFRSISHPNKNLIKRWCIAKDKIGFLILIILWRNRQKVATLCCFFSCSYVVYRTRIDEKKNEFLWKHIIMRHKAKSITKKVICHGKVGARWEREWFSKDSLLCNITSPKKKTHFWT